MQIYTFKSFVFSLLLQLLFMPPSLFWKPSDINQKMSCCLNVVIYCTHITYTPYHYKKKSKQCTQAIYMFENNKVSYDWMMHLKQMFVFLQSTVKSFHTLQRASQPNKFCSAFSYFLLLPSFHKIMLYKEKLNKESINQGIMWM